MNALSQRKEQRYRDYVLYVHLTKRWPSHLRKHGNERVKAALNVGRELSVMPEFVELYKLDEQPMARIVRELKSYGYRIDDKPGHNERRTFDRIHMTGGEHGDLTVHVNGTVAMSDWRVLRPKSWGNLPPPRLRTRPAQS